MPRLAYHPAFHSFHEARKPISPQVEICWALLSMPLSACKTKLWPVRMIQSLEDHLQQLSPPTPQQTSGNEQVCLNINHLYVTNCKIYPTMSISHVYLFGIYRLFVQNKFRFGWFHIRSSSALVRSSTSSNYLHSEICQSGRALQRHHLLQICEVQPCHWQDVAERSIEHSKYVEPMRITG